MSSGSPPSDGRLAPPAPRQSVPAGFAQRVVVGVLITLLILAVAYVLWSGIHVLLEAFAGLLFAIFLSALANWLSQRTRLSYGLALTVVVILLLALAGGLGLLLANRLASQVGELSQKLHQSLDEIQAYLSEYTWGRLLLEHVPKTASSFTESGEFTRMTGLISGVATFLECTIVILVVGIFGAAEPELYREGVLHLVPARHRPRGRKALDAVAFNLRWWLVGQVFLMFIIGATTTAGLWAIGVPLALTLGVIAGVLEMVPYIGPWLSAVPAALMALLVSPIHLAAVLGLYVFLHILEGYVLLPLIQRRSVHLAPALTLVAQVLLGELLGFLGLFVAAPLTVAAVVLLKMLYVEDTLGDQAVDVPGEVGNQEKVAARK